MKKAVFCGSFCPITEGHMNIISRAAKMVDTLYVVVLNNANKKYALTERERRSLVEMACCEIDNVVVDSFGGSLIDYCERIDCNYVIKSARNPQEYEVEVEIAGLNRTFGGVETIILPADKEYESISSTLVRQNVSEGLPIGKLVPKGLTDTIIKYLTKK